MEGKTGAPSDLTNRVRRLRDLLADGLVERDVAVRLALLAALCGEHLLLVGPPGTAKSLVARRLHHAFADARYFERLLTRFSVPEELFGPLSIKGLEEDRYERLTDSYLPTASVAFLDEIFKANSAILNALLTLLNEREFDNGARREKTPLAAVVAASNELPAGEELDALFDRFLLRLHVAPVSGGAFPNLLNLRGDTEPKVPHELTLPADELAGVRDLAEDVEVPGEVLVLLGDLRAWCMAEEIPVSDRRWRKTVKLLQTSALTNGRDSVSVWDCWLLQHCLWSDTGDRERIYNWYASRVGAATDKPARLIRLINVWEGQLKKDMAARSQLCDDEGRPLYMGSDGNHTSSTKGQKHRDGEPLFMAPENSIKPGRNGYGQSVGVDRDNGGKGYSREDLDGMIVGRRESFRDWDRKDAYLKDKANWIMIDLSPAMEPMKHKTVYVADCLKQIRAIRADVETHRTVIDEHIASFEDEIRSHLWVTADFVEPASEGLKERLAEAESLLDRLTEVEKGYNLLPREDDNPGVVAYGNEDGTLPKHVLRW